MRYDRIIEMVQEVDGIGTSFLSDPPDIIGVLYQGVAESGDSHIEGLEKMKTHFELSPNEWREIIRVSDSFKGSPEQRKRYMLDYLMERLEAYEMPPDVNLAEAEEW